MFNIMNRKSKQHKFSVSESETELAELELRMFDLYYQKRSNKEYEEDVNGCTYTVFVPSYTVICDRKTWSRFCKEMSKVLKHGWGHTM